MAIASGLLVLGAWDWKLAPAIAAGSGVVWLLYRLQPGDWRALDRALRDRVQTLFKGDNGKLAIAVAGGSTALLGTYLTTALLTEVHGGWLSGAVVLQGMGTLAAVGLLLWQWFTGDRDRHDHEFAACLADFTHPEPLRQVIALRQAARLLDHQQLDAQQQAALLDCLRVLRDRDLAPPVEVAFLDTVASLRAQRRSARPGARARRSGDRPAYPLANPTSNPTPNPTSNPHGFGAPEHPETAPQRAIGPATAPTVTPTVAPTVTPILASTTERDRPLNPTTSPPSTPPQPLNLPPRTTP
jgi:hypothetical protein